MMDSVREIVLPRPDDFHVHFREGAVLADVVRHTALQFGRALVMPNLKSPVINADKAIAYRQSIQEVVPTTLDFTPLMTLYLTDQTTPDDIAEAKRAGVVAVKWYPAGATTLSDHGVSDWRQMDAVCVALAEHEMLLLIHGEVTDPHIDIFERETRFVRDILVELRKRHLDLRMVLEHITTADSVEFVQTHGTKNLAATITAQHLLNNRNHMLVGGIKPHFYCLPILKKETDRKALLFAATSGDSRFFLGTDSAPHAQSAKETACGCAGCFTGYAALELYATAFESVSRLDALPHFAARFGADYYGLPYNKGEVRLRREQWDLPDSLPFGDTIIRPYHTVSGQLDWKCVTA
jgi:dihydroorotase